MLSVLGLSPWYSCCRYGKDALEYGRSTYADLEERLRHLGSSNLAQLYALEASLIEYGKSNLQVSSMLFS